MEIKNFKFIGRESLKAKFDVYFPEDGFTFRGVSYFEKDQNNSWIGYPYALYQDKEGKEKKYKYGLFEPESESWLKQEVKKHLTNKPDGL